MGRIFLCWTVSQSTAQLRRFIGDPSFSLGMNIGPATLMDLTYTGAIEALAISSIYSDFVPDGVWVAAIHAWALVS